MRIEMTQAAPKLNQLNLVVRDMDATLAVYRRLGLPIALTLAFASFIAATSQAPVLASTRGWVGYIRIQGDRVGQAGFHVSSRGLTAAIQPAPTASPKSNIAVATTVSPVRRSTPRS
jgi:hypothetical protein